MDGKTEIYTDRILKQLVFGGNQLKSASSSGTVFLNVGLYTIN